MLSIVIPVYNGLDFTRQCIDGIKNTTEGSYELIVVDNASTDGTGEYLASCDCRVISNEANRGCAPAWNQGVRASSGDWICILNNDTMLADGWNRILQESAGCHDLAAVMPVCYEGPFDYSLEKAASLHAKSFGTDVIMGAWNGVCMFVRRSTFDSVGLFDERYQFGKYEDVDFVRRINLNGLHVATAKGALIHHFGSKTVEKVKSEVDQDFEKDNHRKFLMTFRHGRLDRFIMKLHDKKIDRCVDAFRKESDKLIDSARISENLVCK